MIAISISISIKDCLVIALRIVPLAHVVRSLSSFGCSAKYHSCLLAIKWSMHCNLQPSSSARNRYCFWQMTVSQPCMEFHAWRSQQLYWRSGTKGHSETILSCLMSICVLQRDRHLRTMPSYSRHVQMKLGYECNSGVGRYYVENIQARFHKKTVHYAINE